MNNVYTTTATDAKSNLGYIMDKAQAMPVLIEKSGRPYVYILSKEEFDTLKALEDAYWIKKAEEGEASGFLGVKETRKFLDSIGKDDVKDRLIKGCAKVYKEKTHKARKTIKR